MQWRYKYQYGTWKKKYRLRGTLCSRFIRMILTIEWMNYTDEIKKCKRKSGRMKKKQHYWALNLIVHQCWFEAPCKGTINNYGCGQWSLSRKKLPHAFTAEVIDLTTPTPLYSRTGLCGKKISIPSNHRMFDNVLVWWLMAYCKL